MDNTDSDVQMMRSPMGKQPLVRAAKSLRFEQVPCSSVTLEHSVIDDISQILQSSWKEDQHNTKRQQMWTYQTFASSGPRAVHQPPSIDEADNSSTSTADLSGIF